MGFHKHSFYIYLVPAAQDKFGTRLEKVNGWANENYTIGFHKNGKIWNATDLKSGVLICTFLTRKECAEWIVENKQKIEDAYKTEKYKQYVNEFNELIGG